MSDCITDKPTRVRLAEERRSVTHKFVFPSAHKEIVTGADGKPTVKMVDVKGYITAGVYPDGRLGEVFLNIGKQGGQWKVYECLMVAVSVALQYGIPLPVFAEKMKFTSFEPHGTTKNRQIPVAKSIVDYLFKWLEMRFPGGYALDLAEVKEDADGSGGRGERDPEETQPEGGPAPVQLREGSPVHEDQGTDEPGEQGSG